MEFLRVLFDSYGATGYLMRSVATMIEQPVQAAEDTAPVAKISSACAGLHLLYRRGLNMECLDILYDVLIRYYQRVRLPNNQAFLLPTAVIKRSYPDGGLDVGLPTKCVLPAKPVPSLPAPRFNTKGLSEVLTETHASNNTVRVISEMIKEAIPADKIRESVHENNLIGSISSTSVKRSLQAHALELHKYVKSLAAVDPPREAQLYDFILDEKNIPGYRALDLFEFLTHGEHVEKMQNQETSFLSAILAGIGATPFEGVDQIYSLQPEMSKCDAICWALGVSKAKKKICGIALENMRILRENTTDQVTLRILSGVRVHGMRFLSYLHQDWLSWVSNVAAHFAALEAIRLRVKQVDQWDKLIGDFERVYLAHAVLRTNLPSLSRF
uniref:Uncharacterized protein n=1 Tax=viral metagenome TaxID=1070528 RepID=A0A2V0RA64_9ZZZZ